MKSFAKFYHEAQRNRKSKKKVGKQKPEMEKPSAVSIGISDHKMKQNTNSDPQRADAPSSQTYMPKG